MVAGLWLLSGTVFLDIQRQASGGVHGQAEIGERGCGVFEQIALYGLVAVPVGGVGEAVELEDVALRRCAGNVHQQLLGAREIGVIIDVEAYVGAV